MKLAPDSYRYLAMGAGEKAYTPFNRRILFPFICKDVVSRWEILSISSIVLLPLLVGYYVYSILHSWESALFAVGLMAGMPSMKFWKDVPVLTDAPALCLSVLAALLPYPFNVIFVCIGAFGRETVPLFAALYAWNPILLVGLIPIGVWAFIAPRGKDQLDRESWLDHPFETAKKFKKNLWLSPKMMVYPLGAALASLFYPSWQLVVTTLVAYSQLVVATDWVRLYVWATPVMCLQAGYIDTSLMLPLLVVHWFNPNRGTGT